MAGNNSIQVLRTVSGVSDSSKTLLAGQPFYNEQKNYLTIGNNDGNSTLNKQPITVPTLQGWFSDVVTDESGNSGSNSSKSTEFSITNNKQYTFGTNDYDSISDFYRIQPKIVNDVQMLQVQAQNIYLDGSVRVKNHIDFGENVAQGLDFGARIVYTPHDVMNTAGGVGTLYIDADESSSSDSVGEIYMSAGYGISLNSSDGEILLHPFDQEVKITRSEYEYRYVRNSNNGQYSKQTNVKQSVVRSDTFTSDGTRCCLKVEGTNELNIYPGNSAKHVTINAHSCNTNGEETSIVIIGNGNNDKGDLYCNEIVCYDNNDSTNTRNSKAKPTIHISGNSSVINVSRLSVGKYQINPDTNDGWGFYGNTGHMYFDDNDQKTKLSLNMANFTDSVSIANGGKLQFVNSAGGTLSVNLENNSTLKINGHITTPNCIYMGSGSSVVKKDADDNIPIRRIDILNIIYPVGAIYITVSTTFNPNTVFGGTWQQITDAYLYAKLNGETAGNILGDNDYKINSSQLPAHTHTFEHTHTLDLSETKVLDSYTDKDLSGTFYAREPVGGGGAGAIVSTNIEDINGNNDPPSYGSNGIIKTSSSSNEVTRSVEGSSTSEHYTVVTIDATHHHTGRTDGVTSGTRTSSVYGVDKGDGTYNQAQYKPKYVAVIVWKRTA